MKRIAKGRASARNRWAVGKELEAHQRRSQSRRSVGSTVGVKRMYKAKDCVLHTEVESAVFIRMGVIRVLRVHLLSAAPMVVENGVCIQMDVAKVLKVRLRFARRTVAASDVCIHRVVTRALQA
jgi:hypothetical protein